MHEAAAEPAETRSRSPISGLMRIATPVLSSALCGTMTVTAMSVPCGAVDATDAAGPHRALAIGFEPDPALPQELPPGFFRLLARDSGREGFPPFGHVGVTDSRSANGGWSLELQLAGGAMAVVTEPRLVPAQPGEVFDASVLVLAEGLDRSIASLAINALDARGAPIEGAAWRVAAPRARGWVRLELRSGAMPDGTKAIEIGLMVVPQEPWDPTGDVAGSVLFDELEVWRIPRVGIELDRSGSPRGAAPRAAVVTIDDPCDSAETHLRLLDQDDRELGAWRIHGHGAASLDLPALGPGAYRLEALVSSGARPLSHRERGFVVAERGARPESAPDAPVRFGFWLERPTRNEAGAILDSMTMLRPDFVVIDLGDALVDDGERLSLPEMRRWCDDLRLERIQPILRISRVSEAIASTLHLERDDPAGLFELDDDSWRRAYGAWFERFGHVVPQWMIASRPGRAVAIESRLDGIVPAWRNLEGEVAIVETNRSARRADADAAMLEGIRLWRDGTSMVALRGAIGDEPGSAALAWSSLASSARGAGCSAELDAGSDLGCLLLSRERSARVLVWRRDGGPARPVTLPFDGDAMHAIDALGAPVALERSRGAVTALVGSTPVVIDGVDPVLGRFLAEIRFRPAVLEGSTAEQALRLELMNPWDVTLEGTLRFVSPVEWSFIPRLQRFTLPPGGAGSATARATLPRSQITGAARVGIELEFTADRGYSLRIDPALEIVVDAFTCEATMRRVTLAHGRLGAVVEFEIVNRSERGLELESTVSTPDGLARRDGPVRIEPGAKARRTVRLDELPSGPVTLSVSQINGPLRLVRALE